MTEYCYHFFGEYYSVLGQINQAINYYEQAISLAKKLGDRHTEANNYVWLSGCYEELGQIDEALLGRRQQVLGHLHAHDRRARRVHARVRQLAQQHLAERLADQVRHALCPASHLRMFLRTGPDTQSHSVSLPASIISR